MARPNDSSRRDQPDTQWLERMYNNLRRVPDHGDYFARWAAESALVRRSLPCQLDLPYGDAAGETLDAFPAERPRSTRHRRRVDAQGARPSSWHVLHLLHLLHLWHLRL